MSVRLNVCLLIFVAAYLIPTSCLADDKFYVIAHMANDERTAGWALRSGANAVEMDINFDGNSGKPTRFHHGTPCDCTCYLDIFAFGSVCRIDKVCKGGSSVDAQLEFLLQYPALALVYIDSKTSKLSVNTQRKAGREVIKTIERRLFGSGYRGKVLIGSANQKAYIASAASEAKTSRYSSRFYFTLDQDRSGTVKTLQFLTSLPVPNIIYSTGISACLPFTYYGEIALAGVNRARGVVSNVFVWTLDKSSSFDKYLSYGARGILTNKVPKLVAWARSKGLQLASPGDDSLPPATTKSITQSLGSCDCDYHPGGCSVSKSAPAFSACKCNYKGFWTCSGAVVACRDPGSSLCRTPDKSVDACLQGGGDCEGYKTATCDCDYKRKGFFRSSGCKIVKASPKNTACKCRYRFLWTCNGAVVRCNDPNSRYCKNPDTSKSSCKMGGGDCDGY